jgi:hypothetical protein
MLLIVESRSFKNLRLHLSALFAGHEGEIYGVICRKTRLSRNFYTRDVDCGNKVANNTAPLRTIAVIRTTGRDINCVKLLDFVMEVCMSD